MRWLSAVVLLGACVDMGDRSSTIVGTSGDVATEPGDYAGYRVVTPCEDSVANVGVIGTGSVELTETADISAAGTELKSALGNVTSIWGWGGYGLACEPGIGTQIHTNSWRDVDMLIVRIGDFLRDNDLSVQVALSVGDIPVAH